MFKKLQRLAVHWEIQASHFSEVLDGKDWILYNAFQEEMGTISEATY